VGSSRGTSTELALVSPPRTPSHRSVDHHHNWFHSAVECHTPRSTDQRPVAPARSMMNRTFDWHGTEGRSATTVWGRQQFLCLLD
jgi:hypothetical protein